MYKHKSADKKKLFLLAKKVQKNAYAAYSNFYVGAAVQSEDGSIFVGCNVENAAYGVTQCAERAAISALIAAGKKKVIALAVVGSVPDFLTPCGACRQWLREFMLPQAPIYLCNDEGVQKISSIAELLPYSFGPDTLEASN